MRKAVARKRPSVVSQESAFLGFFSSVFIASSRPDHTVELYFTFTIMSQAPTLCGSSSTVVRHSVQTTDGGPMVHNKVQQTSTRIVFSLFLFWFLCIIRSKHLHLQQRVQQPHFVYDKKPQERKC